jgi:polyisoprenoid-binding protein YceI
VVLEVEGPTQAVPDQKGKLHAGFSATTTLDRTAFNVGPQVPGAMVGDNVSLDIELEVVKQ